MILMASARQILFSWIAIVLLNHNVLNVAEALSSSAPRRLSSISSQPPPDTGVSRRGILEASVSGIAMTLLGGLTAFPSTADAAADCLKDCVKNCKQIVPNDTSNYCLVTCTDYCEQPDRTDGLSGSVSSEGGEVGILGGTFGTGTVVKGEDKPPSVSLPGLDFKSGTGKKLIGL
mgnify:CR=1 FL=1